MKIQACSNNILVEEISQNDGFAIPGDKNDGLRIGKVISAGDFVWHICHEKIYSPAKVGDVIWFVYNGNEKIPGTNQYLIIYDQCRGIVQ